MINKNEEGESVYSSASYQEQVKRSEHPLYESARELIKQILPNKDDGVVIDIGCNDLVATGKLYDEGYHVLGIDMDFSAVAKAKEFRPDALVAVADINHLPIELAPEVPKVIVILDILEHLDHDDAVLALQDIRKRMGNVALVVSIPNVSPISIPTIKEAVGMIRTGHRPETGVLDRTHKILTNLEGHKQLFEEAGYDINRSETISWDQGASGEWQWKESQTPIEETRNSLKLRAYRLFGRELGPELISKITGKNKQDVADEMTAFHGLYVIRPKEV